MQRKIAALMLLLATSMWAQSAPEIRHGSKEYELFAEGGHSVSGGRGDTTVFSAGGRFGYAFWSLGSNALRGTVEYVVEGIPIYYVAQPGENAFGVSFTPFDLKYNFTAPGTFTPFLELGGGVLFTNHDVPPGTNGVNFTPQAGLGVHMPMSGTQHHVTLEMKYVHISNAGLSEPNPGVNTIQFKVGIGKFRR
jgi:Lipid A 3-O-deacylase (PagL)